VELCTEYAKDVVYRGDLETLKCQPLVFGKQLHRLERAARNVDYVVTDSPILLSVIYNRDYGITFDDSVISIFHRFENINFFIPLDSARYKEYGRVQSLRESLEVETQIRILLEKLNIPYKETKAADVERCLDFIELDKAASRGGKR
jgi:hypothetical protein